MSKMKNSVATFLAIFTTAVANPIAVDSNAYEAEKAWERCLCAIGETESSISCAIGYKLSSWDQQAKYLNVTLPVFGNFAGNETLPKLEVKGKLIEATRRNKEVTKGFRKSFEIASSIPLTLYSYRIPVGRAEDSVTLIFTYRQRHCAGEFLYLPLFESGKTPKTEHGFSLTTFPLNPETSLKLKSRHQHVQTKGPTRITLSLNHGDLIRIGFSKS